MSSVRPGYWLQSPHKNWILSAPKIYFSWCRRHCVTIFFELAFAYRVQMMPPKFINMGKYHLLLCCLPQYWYLNNKKCHLGRKKNWGYVLVKRTCERYRLCPKSELGSLKTKYFIINEITENSSFVELSKQHISFCIDAVCLDWRYSIASIKALTRSWKQVFFFDGTTHSQPTKRRKPIAILPMFLSKRFWCAAMDTGVNHQHSFDI